MPQTRLYRVAVSFDGKELAHVHFPPYKRRRGSHFPTFLMGRRLLVHPTGRGTWQMGWTKKAGYVTQPLCSGGGTHKAALSMR